MLKRILMYNRILNAYFRNAGTQKCTEKHGGFNHFGPPGLVFVQPVNTGICQISAWWVRNKQFPAIIIQYFDYVLLEMVRRIIHIRCKITTPRIMAIAPKSISDYTISFTCN